MNKNTFNPSIDEVIQKLIVGDKVYLSRAITWAESDNLDQYNKAIELIDITSNNQRKTIRISFTGPPGAGKSTLIEHLGLLFIESGHKVAVLTVDPTSNISKGSILGDKTRMQKLAVNKNAYVRPSASKLELGGVNAHTRESILLCEAAGYDIIFIETVGVGQSEIEAKSLSDLMILVINPGGGDDLQGIKKGIIEESDIIVISKSDGSLAKEANNMRSFLSQSLKTIQKSDQPSKTLINVSALNNTNLDLLKKNILTFYNENYESGIIANKRHFQNQFWYEKGIIQQMLKAITNHKIFKSFIYENTVSKDDIGGSIPKKILTDAEVLLSKINLITKE